MRIVNVTEPIIEPVTLLEAKQHARVDTVDDDNLIEIYITAARRYVENYCNISLITQIKQVYLDYYDIKLYANCIYLPVSPIQNINSFSIFDKTNTASIMDPSTYYLAGNRLVLNDTSILIGNVRPYDTYLFDLTLGYGPNSDDVPYDIKQAILRLVAHAYQNREIVNDSVNRHFNDNIFNNVTADLQAYREYSI